ncbi:RagB/SusD family nutrient uptake outer membrane protein [Persicitalea sp.]|uniref:RagB/SusD family nutrient uptake outer membrane protein n=1 Tax=Persicitalea sp. TaxID=3100273 RepID=UPI003593A379
MKKHLFQLTLAAILLTAASACKDVLVEQPKALTVEGFYNTPTEVEAGLAAIYEPIRGQMSGWWIGILESHTEWGAGLSGAANFDSFKSMQGVSSVGANNLIPRWNAFYQSIRNANLVIKYTPDSKILTPEQVKMYVGEAKFLRAFCYFQLVRGWGGVPLHTEENLSESNAIPKAGKEKIYELITADLQDAETNLPDKAPLVGKPSKWTAKSVLADVFLYRNMNKEAAEKANEVIQSGKYSLEKVKVADDFNKVFGMGANSAEEIFYLKYNVNSPSQLVLFTMQISTPWFGANGFGVINWHDQATFYKNWNDDDLRKSFNWYLDKSRSNPFLSGQTAFPNKGVTILSPKKYNNPSATIATFSLPAYRYADVLLIHAEASTTAAGPTEAGLRSLNMVRRRAYGFDPAAPSPVDFVAADYNAKTFVDLVVKERGYEFQLEGKRWFDLVRSGRIKEVMKASIDRDVADKHLLWPIPDIEFDLNKGLDRAKDQNPGY